MRWFASKISFPSAYAVLMGVIVLGAVLTWMLPAGRYDLLRYDQAHRSFVAERATGEETLSGEQATLDRLGIQIRVDQFEKGNIRKPVSIPGTYHTVTAKPQGIMAILKAPVLGTYEAIDVILFVLVIGGFIGVFQKTGAFEAGLNALVIRLRGREALLIIIVTTLISLGGTTFGMAEETLAFYPLLVPVFLAAGYDAMVSVAVIFIGTCVGTMASTVNPFSIIIASNAAGISWTGGLPGRVIMWIYPIVEWNGHADDADYERTGRRGRCVPRGNRERILLRNWRNELYRADWFSPALARNGKCTLR
jgi:uncharacterized ion transporter superfamily protein YfcC